MKSDRFHILASVLLILPLIQCEAFGRVIEVRDQNQFNRMSSSIIRALKEGEKDISVDIHNGTYYFSECHLLFENLNFPDVSIAITGHDAHILSTGNSYSNGDIFNHRFDCRNAFIFFRNEDLPGTPAGYFDFWTYPYSADGPVKVLNTSTGLCMLPFKCHAPLPESCDDIYLNLSKWYSSGYYKIEKIADNAIYFWADDLVFNDRYNDYNVNGDYFYGGMNPQFRLCNCICMADGDPFLSDGHLCFATSTIDSIHECAVTRFVFFKSCNLKSVSLDSLNIWGNRDNNYFLMDFANLDADNVNVKNSFFQGMKSRVMRFLNCPNVTVCNNEFHANSLDCVIVEGNSSHSIISGNTFCNSGIGCRNSFCVSCSSEDYRISGNTFTDFGYSAIGVGVSHYQTDGRISYGIIEHNEIYNTVICGVDNILPMDSGAIYLFTKNDGAVIRYNYIHDIAGRKDNRGIFCDDGASGFSIYGNIITGISNSYCIDSRLVPASRLVNKNLKTNTDNYIGDNLIDGKVRFEYADDNSNYRSGKNYSIESRKRWPYRKTMASFLSKIR